MSQILRDIDWPYIAGFTDGDGYVYVPKGNYNNAAVRIQWSQKKDNEWVLHEISDFLEKQGVSTKWSEQNHPSTRAPGYYCRLEVYRRDDAIFVLENLIPFLIVKLSAARAALKILEARKAGWRLRAVN